MGRWLAILAVLGGSTASVADEVVPICHGYSCITQVDIHFSSVQLQRMGDQLANAVDAADERKILAEVIGQLYAWAGEQSSIRNDRAGNFADDHQPGRMDCIDHSLSTTRLLHLLETRGDLRWHRVVDRVQRVFALVLFAHWSAVIEEKNDGQDTVRFAVDSWFVNNGEPAVILPLDDWMKGAGPDV
ncbi:MAG: hypothetical protein PHT48_01250 [Dechloromonas sp.]|nr:hypothetical protein [Dechloromonas sp.]